MSFISKGSKEALKSDIKAGLSNNRKIMNRSILSWQKKTEQNDSKGFYQYIDGDIHLLNH